MKRNEVIESLLNDLTYLENPPSLLEAPRERVIWKAKIVEALCLLGYNWEDEDEKK